MRIGAWEASQGRGTSGILRAFSCGGNIGQGKRFVVRQVRDLTPKSPLLEERGLHACPANGGEVKGVRFSDQRSVVGLDTLRGPQREEAETVPSPAAPPEGGTCPAGSGAGWIPSSIQHPASSPSSGSQDLIQPVDNLRQFLRSCSTEFLAYPLNGECPDLTDLYPGFLGQIPGVDL